MSFLRRILQRSFCTSLQSPVSIKSISEDLYKERDLKRLVDKFKKASELARFRTRSGIYENTVRRLTVAKRFKWVEEILEEQKKYSDVKKEGFSARLISLYGSAGLCENAQKTFDELPERNCTRTVVSLNALLAAYSRSKKFDMVEFIFKDIPTKLLIEPNLVSYNIVIKAYCEMGSPDSAISLLEEMEKKGIYPDLITYNTLLHWLYTKDRFLDGEKLWSQMGEKNVAPDTRSYNARLRGLAEEKKTKDAIELFEKMKNEGIKPDMFSFNAMFKGFVDTDDLDEAKRWYTELSNNYEYDPNKITFSTLLPFLCQKGDLTTAFELCKDIFNIRCLVNPSILQLVVDSLVKQSMITEAKEIVQLGETNGYRRYRLNLKADE
ncbi:pentatricopeptide repeat-containing protein At1g55890, mitochondrial-like [Prosopis cineraria]|uniref:pentatricopeptide repeat-containing protein At1g55890, mitochondrial-like n=1 Tax=Prosopis cineraria TaxID=364024 RepID=UPI00240EF8C7|nr:pentatricopeptide repeat-containing protein At1g55890, mitochondrial-like [Prosopis cineraria]